MNIAICLNHNFLMPYGVTLQSLCENNRAEPVCVYVITDDTFTKDDVTIFSDIVQGQNKKNEIHVIRVSDEQIEEFAKLANSRYPRQVFYRLLLDSLLPSSVERVLYLDGDIIVRKSLHDLWAMNLEGKAIGAVTDSLSGILEYYNRLHIPITKGYVNAGVLLINLKFWRENGYGERFIKFMREYPDRIVLNDQDVLNFVAQDSKAYIPMKYNLQTMFLYKDLYQNFSIYQFKDEYDEARVDPAIIHFSGCRPWEEGCKHPYMEEFFKYRSETIWKDLPLQKVHHPLKFYVIEFLRWALTPLGITHYVSDYFDRTLRLKDQPTHAI